MKLATQHRPLESGGIIREQNFTVEVGAHIMAVLSGLYADPVDAMVREYLTNMYDAYIAAGTVHTAHKTPVLHCPTMLEPWLGFSDFGSGMAEETVWNVFTKYGASTKNNSNDEVGGFGLGCKTAFCYNSGQPWTIESRWNGERFTFMCSLDDKSIPKMFHVKTEKMSEPNGVSIRIPILRSDVDAVAKAVKKYAPHFPIPIDITGAPQNLRVVQMRDRPAIFKTDNWLINEPSEDRDNYYRSNRFEIVMGNVPYRISNGNSLYDFCVEQDTEHSATRNFVSYGNKQAKQITSQVIDGDVLFYLPVGSVDLVPSRDAVKDTAASRKTLAEMFKRFHAELEKEIGKKLASANTRWERELARKKIDETLLGGEVHYGNRKKDWCYTVDTDVATLTPDITSAWSMAITKTDERGVATITEQVKTISVETPLSEIPKPGYSRAKSVIAEPTTQQTWVVIDDATNTKAVGQYLLLQHGIAVSSKSGSRVKSGHQEISIYFVNTEKTPAEVAKLLGDIPKEYVSCASEYAERAKGVRMAGNRAKVNIYRLSPVTNRWEARVKIPAGATVYYVALTKEGTRYNNSSALMRNNPNEIVKMCGLDVPENIYGVREDEIKKLVGTGWIDFEDYAAKGIVAYARKHLTEIAKLSAHDTYTRGDFYELERVARVLCKTQKHPYLLRLVALEDELDALRTKHELWNRTGLRVLPSDHAERATLTNKIETETKKTTTLIAELEKIAKEKYPMFHLLAPRVDLNSYYNKIKWGQNEIKITLDYLASCD